MEQIKNIIKFPLTPEILDFYTNSNIARYIQDNHLILRISKNNYSTVKKGRGLVTKRYFKEINGEAERIQIGFRLRINDNNNLLFILLKELAEFTAGDGCNLNPIEIMDYCYYHDRNDLIRGYRLRKGVFEDFTEIKGLSSAGNFSCDNQGIVTGNSYGSGFSLKFMEVGTAGYF